MSLARQCRPRTLVLFRGKLDAVFQDSIQIEHYQNYTITINFSTLILKRFVPKSEPRKQKLKSNLNLRRLHDDFRITRLVYSLTATPSLDSTWTWIFSRQNRWYDLSLTPWKTAFSMLFFYQNTPFLTWKCPIECFILKYDPLLCLKPTWSGEAYLIHLPSGHLSRERYSKKQADQKLRRPRRLQTIKWIKFYNFSFTRNWLK